MNLALDDFENDFMAALDDVRENELSTIMALTYYADDQVEEDQQNAVKIVKCVSRKILEEYKDRERNRIYLLVCDCLMKSKVHGIRYRELFQPALETLFVSVWERFYSTSNTGDKVAIDMLVKLRGMLDSWSGVVPSEKVVHIRNTIDSRGVKRPGYGYDDRSVRRRVTQQPAVIPIPPPRLPVVPVETWKVAAIAKLYDKAAHQCVQCGMRFNIEDSEKDSHADWHAKQNRILKETDKSTVSRMWCGEVSDWVAGGQATFRNTLGQFFGDEEEVIVEKVKVEHVLYIEDEDPRKCGVCGEQMSVIADPDDEDQFVYGDEVTRLGKGSVVHSTCADQGKS